MNPGLADSPQFSAGQAATTTVVSPDKKTLLILTSGYNRLTDPHTGSRISKDSHEYVLIFDISNKVPVKKQVVQVPNTYYGIAFDPSGTTFYVSGGINDNIHILDLASGIWAERTGSPIRLGHTSGVGNGVPPAAAGLAISADGNKLVVANYYDDSISILTKNDSGWRIDAIDVSESFAVIHRIKVPGQPNKMTVNADASKLYVAEDQTDSVGVIDTVSFSEIEDIKVGAPAGLIPNGRENFPGHNTNRVTLSPDGQTLYATNGNMNNVAVVDLKSGTGRPMVEGLNLLVGIRIR